MRGESLGFVRYSTDGERVHVSVCRCCLKLVAASPTFERLAIAERAHAQAVEGAGRSVDSARPQKLRQT